MKSPVYQGVVFVVTVFTGSLQGVESLKSSRVTRLFRLCLGTCGKGSDERRNALTVGKETFAPRAQCSGVVQARNFDAGGPQARFFGSWGQRPRQASNFMRSESFKHSRFYFNDSDPMKMDRAGGSGAYEHAGARILPGGLGWTSAAHRAVGERDQRHTAAGELAYGSPFKARDFIAGKRMR